MIEDGIHEFDLKLKMVFALILKMQIASPKYYKMANKSRSADGFVVVENENSGEQSAY